MFDLFKKEKILIKNKEDYAIAINKYALSCWGFMIFILIFAYIIEVFKGLRTIEYVLLFSIVICCPFIFCCLQNRYKGKKDLNLRKSIAVGFLILYSFVLFTTTSLFSWTYIIPLISTLVVYNDTKLIKDLYLVCIFLNLIYITINLLQTTGDYILNKLSLITCFEIQIAILFLSGIFLYRACYYLRLRENLIDILSCEIYKDNLTGIYNKKFFMERIPNIIKGDEDYSIAFIDIDNFKKFNDNYGHDFGDVVLKSTVNILDSNLNKLPNTFFIRFGGDEFVVISKDIEYEYLYEILEKSRIQVSENIFNIKDEKIYVNISIGMANTIIDECDDYFDLYRMADFKLYEAKGHGKNIIAK